MSSRRRLWLRAAALAVVLALSGCGAKTLTAASVATGAEDALEKLIGTRPDIACPEDLEAKVGAHTRCTLTSGNDPARYGVTVTVTSVHGSAARFDVEVDEQPQR